MNNNSMFVLGDLQLHTGLHKAYDRKGLELGLVSVLAWVLEPELGPAMEFSAAKICTEVLWVRWM